METITDYLPVSAGGTTTALPSDALLFPWQKIDLARLQTQLIDCCQQYFTARSSRIRQQANLLARIIEYINQEVLKHQLTDREGIWQISYSACRVIIDLTAKQAFKRSLLQALWLNLQLGELTHAKNKTSIEMMQYAIVQAKQKMYQDLFGGKMAPLLKDAESMDESNDQVRRAQQLALQTELLPYVMGEDHDLNKQYNQMLQRQFYPLNVSIVWLSNEMVRWHQSSNTLFRLRDALFASACKKITKYKGGQIHDKYLQQIKDIGSAITYCISPIAQLAPRNKSDDPEVIAVFKQAVTNCRKKLLPYGRIKRLLRICCSASLLLLGSVLGLITGIIITGITIGADGARSPLFGAVLGLLLFAGASRWLSAKRRNNIKRIILVFLHSLSKYVDEAGVRSFESND